MQDEDRLISSFSIEYRKSIFETFLLQVAIHRQFTMEYDRTPMDADVVKLPILVGERSINVENDPSILGISVYSILRYICTQY